MELQTMKVGSRELPVLGYVETKQTGSVPMVDAPMISDYSWNLLALRSRLANPEFYRTVMGEDVGAEIAKLRGILAQYDERGMRLTQTEAG